MSMRDSSNLVNVQTTASPITVMLPDGTTAISTHTALLNVPSLPLSCRLVHIFPHWHGPLLSIGLLCDAGMIAIYTAANVLILDSAGNLVLHGSRSPVDKIWLIDVSGPPPQSLPSDLPLLFSLPLLSRKPVALKHKLLHITTPRWALPPSPPWKMH